jgi:replicative DNA helicase
MVTPAVERLPPQNVEAEQALLGSLLLDRDAIIRIATTIKAADFYSPRHGTIYQAILDLYNRRIPADYMTVADELGRRDQLDEIGGLSFLLSLVNSVPTAVHAEYYASVVADRATRRRLIAAGTEVVALGFEEARELPEVLDRSEQLVFEVAQMLETREYEPIATILDRYFERIDFIHQHRGDVLGVPTGYRDLDKLTGGLQKSDLIILAARPSVGKCLTADMLVDDPETGERVRIEDFVRERRRLVYGLSERGELRPASVGDWIDSGMKPAYRVRTHTGRTVDVTGHHPFLTVRGWVPLNELSVGTCIAVPRAVPVFGNDETWSADLVRLLAYYIAEGGLTHTSPGFSNTDPVIVADFKAIIARHFPTVALRQERVTYIAAQPRRWDQFGMPPNPVTVWLRDLGVWGRLSKDKAFPACVWRWSRRYLAEFLRVLMSCDGSIYSVEGYPRIELTVASEQLAGDVYHAFVRFGIVARLIPRQIGRFPSWRVQVTDPASVRRYQEEIGWLGEKAGRFAGHVWSVPKRLSNDGHPPAEAWPLVRAATTRSGLSLIELARRSGETDKVGKYAGYNAHIRRSIPRHRLGGYARVLNDSLLRRAASDDLYWDEITAIEPLGERQVYDLTVPDGANFIAADICVHNTSLALGFAYNAAVRFGQRVGVYSLEMSAEQLVQRLLSMETGVDSHRLRQGFINDEEWAQVSRAFGKLAEAKIFIDDTAGLTITDLRSRARRLAAEQGIDLLLLDYLQLMQGSRRSDNRVQEVSDISRGLKALARELNVPIVSLSQLSRAVEGRQEHIPKLSDLRESGCLTGDSLIYLPEQGRYRRLDELVGQRGFRVLAVNTDTWRLESRPVLNAFTTGRKPVYRLATRLGRRIRATANHQFLTIHGWRRLDTLTPGLRLALPRRLPGSDVPTMSDAELGLLGHLIGDGCTLPRHVLQYTTNDPVLAETVARLALQVFGENLSPRINQERAWYQVYLSASYRLGHGIRNPVAAWLDRLGIFGLRSYEKRVPDEVFAQPASQISCFLRHLWATDGCVHFSQGVKHYPNVYYASSSPLLARQVQSLLLRLEINAVLSHWEQGGKGRRQYHVVVTGKEEIERFFERVGTIGRQKSYHQQMIADHLASRITNTNRDVLPRDLWRLMVVPALQTAGLTTRQMQASLETAYCGTGLYKANLSRERAARVARVVSCEPLARLARSDVYWDEIVAIELDGEEEVYDLTVEGLHNFVADDIIVHNSIEQDADIVMFIYREELYQPDTEKKGIAEIHVAKHRNGPVGVVPLRFFNNTARFTDLEIYRQPE